MVKNKTNLVFLIFMAVCFQLSAQPSLPLRTVSVSPVQPLSFGDLTIQPGSSGGTVTVDYHGTRSNTGNVILLNFGGSVRPALYEFKLCPGRSVTITYPSFIFLSGSSGGSIKLNLGPTSVGASGSTFYSNMGCDNLQEIRQGGTIEVGSILSNPPGIYSGSFNITFNQQ